MGRTIWRQLTFKSPLLGCVAQMGPWYGSTLYDLPGIYQWLIWRLRCQIFGGVERGHCSDRRKHQGPTLKTEKLNEDASASRTHLQENIETRRSLNERLQQNKIAGARATRRLPKAANHANDEKVHQARNCRSSFPSASSTRSAQSLALNVPSHGKQSLERCRILELSWSSSSGFRQAVYSKLKYAMPLVVRTLLFNSSCEVLEVQRLELDHFWEIHRQQLEQSDQDAF